MTAINEQTCPSLARGVRLQNDPKTGDAVLLFPEGILFLSETAHEIVMHCDGESTVASIISSLAGEYEVDSGTLRQDVLECLLQLQERQALVFVK